MKHKILVGIPTLGWVKTELMQRLCDEYWNDRRVVIRTLGNVQDVAAARNVLVMNHYDVKAFTHLLLIDADTVPPPRFIDRMLEVDRPVVSGITHIFSPFKRNTIAGPEVRLALWRTKPQEGMEATCENVGELPRTQLMEEKGLVTGCFTMMIQSQVIERLAVTLPFFKTEYIEQTQEKKLSEDLYFCRRVEEELDCRISILTDLVCSHHKTVDLSHVEMMMQNMRDQYRQALICRDQEMEKLKSLSQTK